MGILDMLLRGLRTEEKQELAKEAAKEVAKSAVKGAGDRVYAKVDTIREDFERSAQARRDSQARAKAAREREVAKERDAQALEDELAALKRRVDGEG